MRATLYYNPDCSKCREALKLLEEAGVSPDVVNYLETALTRAQLTELLGKLVMSPQQLLRTGDDRYRELGLAGQDLTEQQALQVLLDHPELMQRPILVVDERAIVARPPERIAELLD